MAARSICWRQRQIAPLIRSQGGWLRGTSARLMHSCRDVQVSRSLNLAREVPSFNPLQAMREKHSISLSVVIWKAALGMIFLVSGYTPMVMLIGGPKKRMRWPSRLEMTSSSVMAHTHPIQEVAAGC